MDEEDGIWIVVDEPEEYEVTETVSGLNILTACYGLFLVADDQTTNYYEDALMMDAFAALDDLQNFHDTVASAMYDVFPPADMSYEGLLQLAKMIIELRDHIDDHPGVKVPITETMDAVATAEYVISLKTQADKLLEEIKQLEDENNE